MTLQEIRNKLEKIKRDLAQKEGERTAILNNLKKEFKIETLDAAYDLFDSLKEQIKSKKEEKDELFASVTKRIDEYGY
jgi:hypothetical protein